MEAVKQGSATVGVKSRTHAVVAALKRSSSELAAHQKKIMPIDSHIAISVSGILWCIFLSFLVASNGCMGPYVAIFFLVP